MRMRNIDFLDVAAMSTFPFFQQLYSDGVHIGDAHDLWYSSVAFSIVEKSFHFESMRATSYSVEAAQV